MRPLLLLQASEVKHLCVEGAKMHPCNEDQKGENLV